MNSGWPDPSGPTASATQQLKEEMRINSLNALALKKSRYSKAKRNRSKERNKRKKAKKQRLEDFSKKLEDTLPKSEVWFRELYLKESLDLKFGHDHYKDQFNKPVGPYIPDVSNKGYRYLIEIDGSWHDQPEAQRYDAKRDHYFFKRGYATIRIKAYDMDSYNEGISKLKAHIEKMNAGYWFNKKHLFNK